MQCLAGRRRVNIEWYYLASLSPAQPAYAGASRLEKQPTAVLAFARNLDVWYSFSTHTSFVEVMFCHASLTSIRPDQASICSCVCLPARHALLFSAEVLSRATKKLCVKTQST